MPRRQLYANHAARQRAYRRRQHAAAHETATAQLIALQTLIADFGYDAVDTHVLQHVCSCGAGGLRRTPCPQRPADPP